MIVEKTCKKCNISKALVLYYKNNRGGRMSTCIKCVRTLGKKGTTSEDKEKINIIRI